MYSKEMHSTPEAVCRSAIDLWYMIMHHIGIAYCKGHMRQEPVSDARTHTNRPGEWENC